MRRDHGFTLIEMVIVVAMVGILAAIGVVTFRAASRNADLSSATYDLAIRLTGLRMRALSEGSDQLFVFVDAPGSDAQYCSPSNSTRCARYFVLSSPAPDWSITTFQASDPTTGGKAQYVDMQLLPKGAHLDIVTTPPSIPPPFDGVSIHDPDLLTQCGGNWCFALRFTSRGEVRPEYASGSTPKSGYAFVLGSDLTSDTASNGADRRLVVVAFPGGIVKTKGFTYVNP
jgi:prepilin-type N-terminal cleavage/methylation domain-containing protein